MLFPYIYYFLNFPVLSCFVDHFDPLCVTGSVPMTILYSCPMHVCCELLEVLLPYPCFLCRRWGLHLTFRTVMFDVQGGYKVPSQLRLTYLQDLKTAVKDCLQRGSTCLREHESWSKSVRRMESNIHTCCNVTPKGLCDHYIGTDPVQ
jgi:hypothetical protein